MTQVTTLRMDGISKAFAGVPAVRTASLTAKGGEAMALMGANGAGKSTMMNVLGGVVSADAGRISLDGSDVTLRSPRDASHHGIAFVHQELTMFPTMSVAENIFIDHMPSNGPVIRYSEMLTRSRELLSRLGSSIDPRTPVEQLSIGDRQLVEIARALRQEARVVIFDEPTSSLTVPERTRLFSVIRGLKDEGVAIIYITHFLEEIFSVCDHVTVMRNGETVWASSIDEVDAPKVVHLMLGVTADQGRIREPKDASGEALLKVSNLTRSGVVEGASFTVGTGEIVGIWGLLGSGRTELLRALVGLDPVDDGVVEWRSDDRLAPILPRRLHGHVGLVTEDRRGEGIHLPLSVAENIALPNLRGLLNGLRLIDQDKQSTLADEIIKRLQIKVAGREQSVGTLSGGNQQKVVFGRWLASNPKLFILDEPTRGLDVSAKAEIMRLVVELAEQGGSCILVSSELEELMRVSDRYLIMSRGRLVGELPGTATSNELMAAVANVGGEVRP